MTSQRPLIIAFSGLYARDLVWMFERSEICATSSRSRGLDQSWSPYIRVTDIIQVNYAARAVKSCLNYMISYVTDRPGGFIESEIADLTRVSQRLPVVADITASGRSPAMCSTPIWARRPVRGCWRARSAAGPARKSVRCFGPRICAAHSALRPSAGRPHDRAAQRSIRCAGEGHSGSWRGDPEIHWRRPPGDLSDRCGQPLPTLHATRSMRRSRRSPVRRLGDDPAMAGEPPLNVVALHAGTVIYGNIGAADRLDFTVIGPAVNLVSRVEAVAKALDLPLVVSDDFRAPTAGPCDRWGSTSCAASRRPTSCLCRRSLPHPPRRNGARRKRAEDGVVREPRLEYAARRNRKPSPIGSMLAVPLTLQVATHEVIE